jgi:hypothetical protein
MKTPIQAFRNFIENDRMQTTYTKAQLLDLIDLLLIDREKAVISKAYYDGLINGHRENTIPIHETEQEEIKRFGNEYYNEKYGL